MRKLIGVLAGCGTGCLCLILAIVISFSISVDERVPYEASTIILKTLIDINAVLIGFWGLIFVYGLNFLRSLRNEALRCIHELTIEMLNLEIRKNKEKGVHETLERIERSYGSSIEAWNKAIYEIDDSIRIFSVWGVFVTAVFVTSIMFSVFCIGKIETDGLHPFLLTIPLATFFAAVVELWIGIIITIPERTHLR